MATIDITRTYLDGEILFSLDLDNIVDGIETFLNTTKLSDDNILNGSITGSLKLVNASVTNAKLADDSIESSNIIDSAVTTSKVNDLAITTNKINDAAVTNAKLANDSVDSNNIIAGSVTRVKLANPNYSLSSGTSTFSTTSTSATAVTNASVTITLTGRPVLIQLMPDYSTPSNASVVGFTKFSPSAGQLCSSEFYLYKNGSNLFSSSLTATAGSTADCRLYISAGSLTFIDYAGTTGSTTYALYCASTTSGGNTTYVQYCRLTAIEI